MSVIECLKKSTSEACLSSLKAKFSTFFAQRPNAAGGLILAYAVKRKRRAALYPVITSGAMATLVLRIRPLLRIPLLLAVTYSTLLTSEMMSSVSTPHTLNSYDAVHKQTFPKTPAMGAFRLLFRFDFLAFSLLSGGEADSCVGSRSVSLALGQASNCWRGGAKFKLSVAAATLARINGLFFYTDFYRAWPD